MIGVDLKESMRTQMSGNENWEQPLISVDVVPVKLNKATRQLEVFVGKRQFEPNMGDFALPGVLLLPNERAHEAAFRALETKTSIPQSAITVLRDVGIADNPDRDPRGPSLSVVMLALVDNDFVVDSPNVNIVTVANLDTTALPFDHATIIRKALTYLDSLTMSDKEATRGLLGNIFKTTDLHASFTELHSVSGSTAAVPDLSNLSRTLKNNLWFESTTVKETPKAKGRPASGWGFTNA